MENGSDGVMAPCELHSAAISARQRKGGCAAGRVETRPRRMDVE
jgi:hypothetical protein